MNIQTLEDYLYDLDMLIQSYGDNPTKAEGLRIKIIDALKELKLYDPDSVFLGFLKFKKQYDFQDNPYRDSLNKMKSHLESKKEVLKHRISLFERQQQRERENLVNRENERVSKLSQRVKQLESVLTEKDNEIRDINVVVDDLRSTKEQQEKDLRKKQLIHGFRSAIVWTIIITIFIGLLGVVYSLGKDNGTKADDVEKATLRTDNKNLIDSLNIKDTQIDSLKKLIPKARPVD